MTPDQPTLGKYHLLERLAADEIAEIYKVKTIGIAGFEKVQVLKRVLPGCAQDPKFIRAFIDEAKIAFSLNHRNIVQVFEFGKVDGDLFLAVEYIPGANLQELLLAARRQRKQCAVGLTCYLMGEVAAGLEYAHRKTDHFGQDLSIVHCEIRPRNIACSFEGSVKILDFGISRAVWNLVLGRGLSGWNPRYASPEQLHGAPLDARSDLFNFGTILWEMLTGLPLFDGETAEQTRENVLRKPISPPATINPDVPAHLDDLTMHCLMRDPNSRIRSASDLQMELHRIQRMLGAVIGSRALSSYIDDLLPGYNDTRDVRQEGPEERAAAAAPAHGFDVPLRSDDMVDAAAELAQPPNPPAEAVQESPGEPRIDSVALHLPEEDLAIHPIASQEAELAGVLRSGRLPDDEVAVSRRRRSQKLTGVSSDEVTAGPIIIRPPRAADEATVDPAALEEPTVVPDPRFPGESQEISLSELLDLDDDDLDGPLDDTTALDEQTTNGADEPDTDTRGPFAKVAPAKPAPPAESAQSTAPAPAAELAPPAYVGNGPGLSTKPSTGPGRTALAQPLGEKKRFIAATLVLEGDPAAMDEARVLVADIAFKFEGIIHDEQRDMLVALFGLPTADENDVVAAIRFALDAQEALVSAAGGGRVVAPRVGIRAGTARMGGHPSREGYHLLGNTLVETEALARHAPAGQSCLAGVAARLASVHYVLRPVKPLRRHGKMIRCYRVLAPRSRAPVEHSAATGPFVGREVELKAVRSAYREAVLRSTQRAILLAGEPGIGKSRLVDEFIARQSAETQVIAAFATPHRRGTPYSLLVDLARSVTSVWSGSSSRAPTKMVETLRRLLEGEEPQLLEAVESLVVPRERTTSEGGGFSLLAIHRAMRRLLTRMQGSRPLVIILEDLHWADNASIDCLSHLIEHPEEAGPTLFLMTIRPDEELVPENLFSSGSSFLLLEELDEPERKRLIQEELGQRSTDDLVREVDRRAGGNPFYIRELCHAFQELKATGPTDVPPTVQGVVAGRVDRLPAQVKSLLQHAAVIGPTFREGILAQLIGRNPARSLGVLRNRGIIVPGLRPAVPNPVTAGKSEQFEREWAFRHVLIQEVVYEALGNVVRRDLHRAVGEIMAKRIRRGSNDPPAEVARHLELGGLGAEAGEFYLQAANEAAAAFASREALALYDRTLPLCEGDPDREYELHAGRERMHAQLGMHGEQAADLEVLRRLCGENPTRLADLRNREAVHLLRLGEFYRALAAAEQAEDAATSAGDELARGEALQLRGEAYERLNDHERAIDAVTKALSIFEQEDAIHNQVRARIGLGRINLVQAKYDEAFAQFDPALELIKETGDRWHERVLRYNLAVVDYCRGDFTMAFNEASYSLELCRHFGDLAREGDNATVLGIIYLELGMHDMARRHLETALAMHKETGSQWSEADTLVYVGLLEAASRRHGRALRFLDRAKRIAERIGAKYITVNARNATAWALCESGSTNDAARATDEATEAAETARQARLIVGEIPGLSRSARATAMLGNIDAARALSRRAVELLEAQRIIESSEEEIFYTHYRILAVCEDGSAEDYLERAHQGYLAKLQRLQHPEHRESFASSVRLNRAIRRDHSELIESHTTQP